MKKIFVWAITICCIAFTPSSLANNEPQQIRLGEQSNQYPEVLQTLYTGQGKMPLGEALKSILPPQLSYILKDVSAKRVATWDKNNVPLYVVLDEIAERADLEWSFANDKITFVKYREPVPQLTPARVKTKIVVTATDPIKTESVPKNETVTLVPSVSSLIEQSYKEPVADSNTVIIKEEVTVISEQALSPGSEQPLSPSRPAARPPTIVSKTREGNFQIKNDDETLFLALRRWAEESDYQIVWDAGKDFPARKTTYQANNIEDAIAMVMHDTARSSYPLHACAYSNRVVRVLHISQSCERKGP